MDIKDFIVEAGEQSLRIDRYLSERCADFSRSYLQKLLKDQAVSVNGKPVKANYKTQEGDHILLEIPDLKEPDILPEDIPLDILSITLFLSSIVKYLLSILSGCSILAGSIPLFNSINCLIISL